MIRVSCYIDGFNLYHAIDDMSRASRGELNHLKWLDLNKLMSVYTDPHVHSVFGRRQQIVILFRGREPFSLGHLSAPQHPPRQALHQRRRPFDDADVDPGPGTSCDHFGGGARGRIGDAVQEGEEAGDHGCGFPREGLKGRFGSINGVAH